MLNFFLRIKPFLKDIVTLGKLAFAFVSGSYRNISNKAIAGIVFGFVYLISPVDLIPDFFTVFGLADDVAVVGFITYLLREDLDAFRSWEDKQKENLPDS